MQGHYKLTIGDQSWSFKNIVTDAGKRSILNVLAGKKMGLVGSVVVGIGATAATEDDLKLDFLVGGADINVVIVDPVNKKLYFKATLPVQDQYTIYEFGALENSFMGAQQSPDSGGLIIATLSSETNWTDTTGTHTTDTTNSRIGVDSLGYTLSASATGKGYTPLVQDLSFLPDSSSFTFAYYVTGIADVIVRFKVDDSNYYQANTWPVTNGYQISSVLKSAFTTTGSPTWDAIRYLELEAVAGGSGGSVFYDAIRYNRPVGDENNLLSRVVLGTPKNKIAGVQADIEYMLEEVV